MRSAKPPRDEVVRVRLRDLYFGLARDALRRAVFGDDADFFVSVGDAIRWTRLAMDTPGDAWLPAWDDEPAVTTHPAERIEA